MGIRLSLAAVAAGLFLAAALAGCTTTADSSATVGLHGGASADQPSFAALAEPPSGAALAQSDAAETQPPGAATEPQTYYVEFRARPSPATGHSYMLYGPLDRDGRPLEDNVIGFFPKGGAIGLAAGSAPIPVPGELGTSWADKNLPVLVSYRTTIGPAQYRNLLAFIARERQKTKYWNLWAYNCNSFAGEFARAAGLEAPMLAAVSPIIYIAALQAMNEGGNAPDVTMAAARRTAPLRNDQPSLND